MARRRRRRWWSRRSTRSASGSLLASLDGGDHQTIVIDNGSPGDDVAAVCAEHGAEVVRSPDQPRLLGRRQPRGRARRRARRSCSSTTTASATRASSSGSARRLDPAAGVGMVAGVMRDWSDEIADRHRRDGARPDAARLRLAQRRAALGARADRSPSDRAVRRRRRVRPRRLHRGGRLRRAAVRLLGGRRPRPAPAAGRPRLRAGRGRAGRAPALGDPALGLGAQELPDGLRARLRAAQVGRAHPGPGGPDRASGGDPLRRASSSSTGRRAGSPGGCAAIGRAPGARSPIRRPCSPARGRTAAWSPSSPGGPAAAAACAGARSRPTELRTLAVFHLADTSGPSRSLERELAWLASEGSLDVVLPAEGSVGDALPERGDGAAARLRGADHPGPCPRRPAQPASPPDRRGRRVPPV